MADFQRTADSIEMISVLHWTEHCTECAMPACFKTCELYSPRIDAKCARFVHGIQAIDKSDTLKGKILKIQFKQWGVLETQGNSKLVDFVDAEKIESRDLNIAKWIRRTPSKVLKKKLIQKRYSVKKNKIKNDLSSEIVQPEYLLLESYNPHNESLEMNLTIRNEDEKYRKIPFQYKFEIAPGYNKELIPFSEIEKRIKTDLNYRISLIPNNISESHTLYFGFLEFVKFRMNQEKLSASKKVKCIAWDLDNTLWQGILVEDGLEGLKLRPNIKGIITDLDERGVIHSIASKNNYEEAIKALEHFELAEYFIFPKFHGGLKVLRYGSWRKT